MTLLCETMTYFTKNIPAHICLHCFWKFETLAAYTILTFFPARFSPPLKVQLNPTVLLLMTWILGSRLFQCQLCSRGFTGKAQLLSHFKNVHSEQIGAFSWISVKLLHFFKILKYFFYERWLFLGLLKHQTILKFLPFSPAG